MMIENRKYRVWLAGDEVTGFVSDEQQFPAIKLQEVVNAMERTVEALVDSFGPEKAKEILHELIKGVDQ